MASLTFVTIVVWVENRRKERQEYYRFEFRKRLVEAGEMDAAANDSVVRRAVALLPPKYRDAIVVYYFQQRDVAETAGTLGLRPGTVKARLHRARKLLETKLRALGHPLAVATNRHERRKAFLRSP